MFFCANSDNQINALITYQQTLLSSNYGKRVDFFNTNSLKRARRQKVNIKYILCIKKFEHRVLMCGEPQKFLVYNVRNRQLRQCKMEQGFLRYSSLICFNLYRSNQNEYFLFGRNDSGSLVQVELGEGKCFEEVVSTNLFGKLMIKKRNI